MLHCRLTIHKQIFICSIFIVVVISLVQQQQKIAQLSLHAALTEREIDRLSRLVSQRICCKSLRSSADGNDEAFRATEDSDRLRVARATATGANADADADVEPCKQDDGSVAVGSRTARVKSNLNADAARNRKRNEDGNVDDPHSSPLANGRVKNDEQEIPKHQSPSELQPRGSDYRYEYDENGNGNGNGDGNESARETTRQTGDANANANANANALEHVTDVLNTASQMEMRRRIQKRDEAKHTEGLNYSNRLTDKLTATPSHTRDSEPTDVTARSGDNHNHNHKHIDGLEVVQEEKTVETDDEGGDADDADVDEDAEVELPDTRPFGVANNRSGDTGGRGSPLSRLPTKDAVIAIGDRPKTEDFPDAETGVGAGAGAGGGSERGRESTARGKDAEVIIYNRIPKTGSTTFAGLLYDLCQRNNFHVIHMNISKNWQTLSLHDQYKLVMNISNWEEVKPAVYHGHFAYLPFDKFGAAIEPIYINLVRDPLERFISYYYFLRNGDVTSSKKRKRSGDNTTFDECVDMNGTGCDPALLWKQVAYFCGQTLDCKLPSKWALSKAKRNLAERYFLVGVLDDFGDFLQVLETSLPRYFSGITQLYKTYDHGSKHRRQTTNKPTVLEKTRQRFRHLRVWQLEQEFYNFARQLFHETKQRLLERTVESTIGGAGERDFQPLLRLRRDAEDGDNLQVRAESQPQPQLQLQQSFTFALRINEFHFEKIKPALRRNAHAHAHTRANANDRRGFKMTNISSTFIPPTHAPPRF